jgi:predicted transcriptional regulator
MSVKEQISRVISELPDDCTFEDAQYKLYLLQKIQNGLNQIDRGEGVPHEDVKAKFAKWLND